VVTVTALREKFGSHFLLIIGGKMVGVRRATFASQ
jgi:hypothetical protein